MKLLVAPKKGTEMDQERFEIKLAQFKLACQSELKSCSDLTIKVARTLELAGAVNKLKLAHITTGWREMEHIHKLNDDTAPNGTDIFGRHELR